MNEKRQEKDFHREWVKMFGRSLRGTLPKGVNFYVTLKFICLHSILKFY
jgi:hypothetical protein